MSRIRGKNTKPELTVRSILHRLGYRFRLHHRDLPGNPDVCLPKHKAVVFVHGCFWHQHEGCKYASMPTSNKTFWTEKLRKNVVRDQKAQNALHKAGWKVLVVWGCEVKNREELAKRLEKALKA